MTPGRYVDWPEIHLQRLRSHRSGPGWILLIDAGASATLNLCTELGGGFPVVRRVVTGDSNLESKPGISFSKRVRRMGSRDEACRKSVVSRLLYPPAAIKNDSSAILRSRERRQDHLHQQARVNTARFTRPRTSGTC